MTIEVPQNTIRESILCLYNIHPIQSYHSFSTCTVNWLYDSKRLRNALGCQRPVSLNSLSSHGDPPKPKDRRHKHIAFQSFNWSTCFMMSFIPYRCSPQPGLMPCPTLVDVTSTRKIHDEEMNIQVSFDIPCSPQGRSTKTRLGYLTFLASNSNFTYKSATITMPQAYSEHQPMVIQHTGTIYQEQGKSVKKWATRSL